MHEKFVIPVLLLIFYKLFQVAEHAEMLATVVKPGIFRHIMCRNNVYPRSNVSRFPVPDEVVFWTEPYVEYSPPFYTAAHIGGQSWADAPLPSETSQPRWNHNDGIVNRVSFHGDYQIKDGLPQNPIGRTGLTGRGLLGRWGPNHAADPIVTRWKRDAQGHIVSDASSGKYVECTICIIHF